MWTLIVMLHAVSPNVPPARGSITMTMSTYDDCQKAKEAVVRGWGSDRYRVSANCLILPK